jgi:eukaryotic-like serine/threonine-protein kinase
MKECLSESAFGALLNSSAPADQITRWKRHLRQCDSCATYFIKLQTSRNGAPAGLQNAVMADLHGESILSAGTVSSRLEPNVQIGDFIIEKRIGSGGMGTVYQACQVSLNRKVALKVMSCGALVSDKAVERFHKEARAAAKLHHTNIVAIYAEGQEGQTCYYAMELVEGQTLDKIIESLKTDRNAGLASAIPERIFTSNAKTDTYSLKSSGTKQGFSLKLTDPHQEHFDSIARLIADIADALHYVHKNGILHRDIKPSNLILGTNGRINLMDFGLARMLEEHSVTMTGTFLGTPHYMSPEQLGSSKHKIDHRTDIYSLGVTLYELLTLQTPFLGETHEQIVTAILTKEFVRPRRIDGRIPQDLETICCKAMEKEPDRRYQDAGQMAEDLRRYVNRYAIRAKRANLAERMVKFVRRHKALSAMTAVIAVMTTMAAVAGWNYFTYRWVKKDAIPDIKRLIDAGTSVTYLEALKIAKKAQIFAPHDPELLALFSEFTKIVSIDTNPSGAYIYMRSYDQPEKKWISLGKSPINNIRLAYGLYQWRVVKPGYTTLERRDTIQESMKFTLEKQGVTPPGMVKVDGGSTRLALMGMSQFNIDLPDFYIDRYEVTNKQFKEFIDSGGYQDKKYWKEPFIKNGVVIPWADAVKEFIDTTGRPGPAGWSDGQYPQGQDDYPVAGISWYEAAAYAEFVGKQLPTIYHWSYAGITEGNYAGTILRFSNFDDNGVAPVGKYHSFGDYGTYDMAGNIQEWCWNQAEEGTRYILGGAWNDPQYKFVGATRYDPFDRSLTNGLRCIKNAAGGEILARAYEPITVKVRDYANEKPISDEGFQLYKKSLYDYDDHSSLNPVTIAADETFEYWSHEAISFDAAYGNERMTAHLYLPKNTSPPYQVVIYFPGSAAAFLRQYSSAAPLQFALRSGRAILFPIYKGTYERSTGLTTTRPDTSESYKNHVIWWAKDLSRSIDYLKSRNDIQHDKIAYFGWSWGAVLGAIFPAVENRIKTCVLVGGGFYFENSRSEVDQINFAKHVKVPVLMLNGQYDSAYLFETSQKPMFDLLGTAAEDKKHILVPGGHLPKERINQETLNWFDKYLGPVELNTDK